jgi:hypothetical protein
MYRQAVDCVVQFARQDNRLSKQLFIDFRVTGDRKATMVDFVACYLSQFSVALNSIRIRRVVFNWLDLNLIRRV